MAKRISSSTRRWRQVSRRLRSGAVATPIVCAFVAAAGLGAIDLGSPSSVETAAAAHMRGAPLPTLNELLDARSPGVRRFGWLSNTKGPRRLSDSDAPKERVLSTVRRRPDAVADPAGPAPDDAALGNGVPAGSETPVSTAADPTAAATPAGPASSNGFLPNPGQTGVTGGDPGSISGNPTNNGDPDAQTPAVPEPATWAMMILGFALIGASLRSRGTARQSQTL